MIPPLAAPPPQPLWQRLAWLLAIWTASVLALGGTASLIRLWLKS